jgi:LysR family transcriptional regulator, carnitine catabolism transcriptional activator
MRVVDRRHVEYFLAVADAGGFTRAADQLRIAQPTLSQAIAALEREVGTALFHRVGRTVRLTSAGDALIEPARRVLRDFAVAEQSVAQVRGLAAGHLDIAAIPTLSHELSQLLGAYREAHPAVAVRCPELDAGRSVEAAVRSGECEVGLTELPLADSALVQIELGQQPFHLALPPGAVSPATFPLSRFDELEFIATPTGTSSRTRLEEALDHTKSGRRVIGVETGHREALIALVLAGAGAAFLPQSMAAQARELGATVVPTSPVIRRRYGLVHRAAPLSPAAQAFLRSAQDRHVATRRPARPNSRN